MQIQRVLLLTVLLGSCGQSPADQVPDAPKTVARRVILKCSGQSEMVVETLGKAMSPITSQRTYYFRIDDVKKTVEKWDGQRFSNFCTGHQPCRIEISPNKISVIDLDVEDTGKTQNTHSDTIGINRITGSMFDLQSTELRENYQLQSEIKQTMRGSCEESAQPPVISKAASTPKF